MTEKQKENDVATQLKRIADALESHTEQYRIHNRIAEKVFRLGKLRLYVESKGLYTSNNIDSEITAISQDEQLTEPEYNSFKNTK